MSYEDANRLTYEPRGAAGRPLGALVASTWQLTAEVCQQEPVKPFSADEFPLRDHDTHLGWVTDIENRTMSHRRYAAERAAAAATLAQPPF